MAPRRSGETGPRLWMMTRTLWRVLSDQTLSRLLLRAWDKAGEILLSVDSRAIAARAGGAIGMLATTSAAAASKESPRFAGEMDRVDVRRSPITVIPPTERHEESAPGSDGPHSSKAAASIGRS